MKQLLSSPDFLLSLEQVGIRLVNLISKAFLSSAVGKGIVRDPRSAGPSEHTNKMARCGHDKV
jgi:hypothetical protein